jgi:hypothetical protein
MRKSIIALGFFAVLVISTLIVVFLALPKQKIIKPQAKIKQDISVNTLHDKKDTFSPNELLIKVKPSFAQSFRVDVANPGSQKLKQVFADNSAKKIEKLTHSDSSKKDIDRWYKLTLNTESDTEQELQTEDENGEITRYETPAVKASQDLNRLPEIEAVSLNYKVRALRIPNDPYYSSSGSWGTTVSRFVGFIENPVRSFVGPFDWIETDCGCRYRHWS